MRKADVIDGAAFLTFAVIHRRSSKVFQPTYVSIKMAAL
jgi:hypothetical protein